MCVVVVAAKKYNSNDTSIWQQLTCSSCLCRTDLDGHTRYVVKKGHNSRVRHGRRQFLVKWQGYRIPTCKTAANLRDKSCIGIEPLHHFLVKLISWP